LIADYPPGVARQPTAWWARIWMDQKRLWCPSAKSA